MVMNDMTDDGKWGAAIPIVDGKRPKWLENNLDIPIKTAAGWKGEVHYFDGDNAGWHWQNITAIRLPASHPHYKQTQPIDWSAPIEAVHEDGRVVAVERHRSGFSVVGDLEGGWFSFNPDGSHAHTQCQWRIRNVQPTTQTQTLTAQEHLARMEALVRKIATYTSRDHHTSELLIAADEARALVAEMEPVDADLAEARNILATCGWVDDDASYDAAREVALEALKRGRELARGDVA